MILSQRPVRIVSARRNHRKLAFPFRQVFRFQIAVGLLQRSRPSNAQTLHQAILRGLEAPLHATLGLRRVRRNPANPEFLQPATDLGGRQRFVAHRMVLLRGRDEVAGLVHVELQRPSKAQYIGFHTPMFSAVESLRTNRPNKRLVASSIILIR